MSRREETIEFRVSAAEKKRIKRQANSADLSVSEYLRSVGTSREAVKSVPQINKEIWANLSRSLSNLNQLMYHINADRVTDVDPQLVEEIYSMVQALRKDLRGNSQ